MVFFGGSLLVDVLVLLASLFVAIYAFLSYHRSKWTKRGIPYHNVHPLLGNLGDVFFRGKNLQDVIRDFYLEHKDKPFIGFFSFIQPTVMINDIELMKSILVKNFNSFSDRNFSPSEADAMEYHSVFGAKGQTWKDLRSKLSPTFTSGKMKRMFVFIDECGKALVTCLEREKGETGEVEIKEFFGRFSTDVIASVTFGIEGNALKDAKSNFRKMMKRAITLDLWQNILFALSSLFPSAVEKLKVSITKPDVADFFRSIVWDNVDYRKKQKVTRNDFLDLLIQIKDKGFLKDNVPLDDGEITEQTTKKIDLEGDKFVAQCFVFLTAGFETSSSTMSFAFYEMALNPEIQNRLYEEIISVLPKHGDKVTYDAVQEMEYLHMVLQETLRKYPVLHFLDRQVTSPYRFPGTNIELARGDSVMIPVIGLHYDPELYPEPDRFDPERFSTEQFRNRPACSFLGFGDGPRICIGMRLGYLQAKVGLIHMLLNYEVSPCSTTPIPIPLKNASPINQVEGGIPLKLKKRGF